MRAALLAIGAGADGITAHLREDRRHIRDADMARLKDEISKPLNFEMAATPDMLRISLATNLLDTELPPCVGMASHRWRFARSGADGSGAVLDRDRSLGICGDWLIGPRVEAAWMSGTMLADMIRQSAGESPARHV